MTTLSKSRLEPRRGRERIAGLMIVLGLATPAAQRIEQPDETSARARAVTAANASAQVRKYQITAEEGQIIPGHLRVKAGETIRITFVSRDDNYGIRFKDFGIKEKLTPDKPVVIEIHPTVPGTYEFRCARPWGVSRLTSNGTLFVTE
jgi:heme/copper-type cytochrome/quinol oxidase subunit 2